jgi:glycosyltransferase involved in cell wall biosynthesis
VLHATTNAAAAERLSAWAGVPVEVFPFFHTFGRPRVTERNRGLREALGIDPAALVIARCTRVVPPKRIDRDLHLLAEMKRRMDGRDRPVCLVVTGPTDENAAEHRRLVEMARGLGVEGQVRWAGGMLSFEEVLNGGRRAAGARWSVRDLLAHAELSSFLTSHRFEGYGLPPGEAIAAGVPFISSRYELYDAVWGRHGFRTLPFDISPADTELPGRDYAERVLAYLRDPGRRRADAAFNQRLGRPLLSIDAFEDRFAALFPGILAGFPRSPRPPRRRTSHLAHDA